MQLTSRSTLGANPRHWSLFRASRQGLLGFLCGPAGLPFNLFHDVSSCRPFSVSAAIMTMHTRLENSTVHDEDDVEHSGPRAETIVALRTERVRSPRSPRPRPVWARRLADRLPVVGVPGSVCPPQPLRLVRPEPVALAGSP